MPPLIGRMTTSFVVPLFSTSVPSEQWRKGPYPNSWRLGVRKLSGDRAGRRQYVNPGIDELLYENRWHQLMTGTCPALPSLELKAMEVLALPTEPPQPNALLVVHGRIDVSTQDAFAVLRRTLNHNPSHGAEMRDWLSDVVDPWANVHSLHRRSAHVTLVTTSGPMTGESGTSQPAMEKSAPNEWLAQIASYGRYAPDVDLLPDTGRFIGMSENLRGLVSRSCIALAGLKPDSGLSDGSLGFDYGGAEFFAEGLYADVLLLGQLQAVSILQLRERISEARRRGSSRQELDSLELNVVDFRQKYWRRDVAPQGSQDEFLVAFQEINSLGEMLSEVTSQLTEYSAHVQRHEQQLTNAVLGLVALLAFPLSIAVTIWAGIDQRTTTQLVIAILSGLGTFLLMAVIFPGVRKILGDLLKAGNW